MLRTTIYVETLRVQKKTAVAAQIKRILQIVFFGYN